VVPFHAQLEQQPLAQDMKERIDAYRAGKEKEVPLYDQQQRDVEAKALQPLSRHAFPLGSEVREGVFCVFPTRL
jgi:hypothetical protein